MALLGPHANLSPRQVMGKRKNPSSWWTPDEPQQCVVAPEPATSPWKGMISNQWWAEMTEGLTTGPGEPTATALDPEAAGRALGHQPHTPADKPTKGLLKGAPNGAGADSKKSPLLKRDWRARNNQADIANRQETGSKVGYDNGTWTGTHTSKDLGSDNYASGKVKIGKDSYMGEGSVTQHNADGTADSVSMGGGYNKGYWTAKQGYTHTDPHADPTQADNTTDRKYSKSLGVNSDGDVKASASVVHGKGKHARGGSINVDSATGSYGGTFT